MRKILLILLLSNFACADVSVLISNATIGESIYFLATEDGKLANGTVFVSSPSGKKFNLTLIEGQVRINETEVGEWKFTYLNKTYTAHVSDIASIRKEEKIESFNFPIEALIPLFLLPLLFLLFFLLELSKRRIILKKTVSEKNVQIYIKNLLGELREVRIRDGEKIWKRNLLRFGEEMRISYPAKESSSSPASLSAKYEGEQIEIFSEEGEREKMLKRV